VQNQPKNPPRSLRLRGDLLVSHREEVAEIASVKQSFDWHGFGANVGSGHGRRFVALLKAT